MRTAHAQELTSDSADDFIERPALTDKQIEFFHVYMSSPFLSLREICNQAQVQQRTVKKWIAKSEPFRKALTTEQNRSRAVSNMSRKRVMRGMLEAVDMARDSRQPNTMLSGWKEIGRMCGFYEPERREVILSVDRHEVMKEMKTLTREQLLEIAEDQDLVDPGTPEIFDTDGVIDA
jgi:predicted DNA-binding protein YlxM (UPF0122 family)